MWEKEYDDIYSDTYESDLLDQFGRNITVKREKKQRCGFALTKTKGSGTHKETPSAQEQDKSTT
ncbi:MAG: hypothetical protein COA78_20370 [Blastopirellula sp.]|nr:MAG: hypothetical protein COA78_20370 [Blastopirellula sp.]